MRQFLAFLLSILSFASASAQTQDLYIKHSSGLVLTYDASKDKGVIVQPSSALVRPLVLKENSLGIRYFSHSPPCRDMKASDSTEV